ncbi:MAG: threonylcarbamoyl-AMP synthase [Betaproteobacteria bacterium]|nr:threonylcarbamoyl-AMP synthase [Betaproteobacteria bacterium]MDE2208854.1 threonylcarbamoyl-AMP synthase [Betaproteobacteria bacterium]
MSQRFTLHPTHPQPRLVRAAAAIIREGGVIAYPTDSSYALGCGVREGEAARRIRTLRGMDLRHHLTLVCKDLAQVGVYARMDNWQFLIVRQGTPGSYTFLLPASREVPRAVQHPRRSTIGVRVPDHPVVRALLAELGEPILSSTLILPGSSDPLNDAVEIQARLDGRIEGIVDAGPCPAEPTTVIDLAQGAPALVRQGRGDLARLGIERIGVEGGEV